MTDTQLLVLAVAIVFPVSVLIYQIGFIISALNRLNETLRSIRTLSLR